MCDLSNTGMDATAHSKGVNVGLQVSWTTRWSNSSAYDPAQLVGKANTAFKWGVVQKLEWYVCICYTHNIYNPPCVYRYKSLFSMVYSEEKSFANLVSHNPLANSWTRTVFILLLRVAVIQGSVQAMLLDCALLCENENMNGTWIDSYEVRAKKEY